MPIAVREFVSSSQDTPVGWDEWDDGMHAVFQKARFCRAFCVCGSVSLFRCSTQGVSGKPWQSMQTMETKRGVRLYINENHPAFFNLASNVFASAMPKS